MSEYATVEHYVDYVVDEINRRDVEQISERLRAFGWEEVVRCKDCANYYNGRCESEHWSTASLMPSHRVTPDGFCAWGEKGQS